MSGDETVSIELPLLSINSIHLNVQFYVRGFFGIRRALSPEIL